MLISTSDTVQAKLYGDDLHEKKKKTCVTNYCSSAMSSKILISPVSVKNTVKIDKYWVFKIDCVGLMMLLTVYLVSSSVLKS